MKKYAEWHLTSNLGNRPILSGKLNFLVCHLTLEMKKKTNETVAGAHMEVS